MLRFIAIVAGLIFAARALKSNETGAGARPATRFADGVSEEDVEQELHAKV